MPEPPPGEAFWRFSLAFYARPGVAEALIALQDRDGSDVNLILFALWLALRSRPLDEAALAAVAAAAGPLREVADELRQSRRRLKSLSDPDLQAMYRRLLILELAAERAVQFRLAASLPPVVARADDRAALAAANLARHLGAAAAVTAEAASLCREFAEFIRRR